MKKLLIIVLLASASLGASAQHGFHGGGGYYHGGGYYGPRVGIGIGLGYPYYGLGYPYGPYYGWGYPYYDGGGYGYGSRPSKLSLEIDDIKNDYKARIWAAKHDKNLPRHERRKQVHQLKADRDREINEAKRRYYRY